MMFKEYSKEAEEIMETFEIMTKMLSKVFDFSLKSPPHDMARRFLNEIKEFEPIDRRKGGRIGDR